MIRTVWGLALVRAFICAWLVTNVPLLYAQTNAPAPTARSKTEQDKDIQITRRKAPSMVDPDVMRGYAALQKNQLIQAREAYAQALLRNPAHRDALLGIAYAHYGLGDTAQATSTLQRLAELYPRDADVTSALFLVAGAEAQIEESKLKQLLDRNERSAALHHALGVLYFDQSRFGEAERAFDRAHAMNPEQADYAYNLALALDRLGRTRDAARKYVLALNLLNQSNAAFNPAIARTRLRMLLSSEQP